MLKLSFDDALYAVTQKFQSKASVPPPPPQHQHQPPQTHAGQHHAPSLNLRFGSGDGHTATASMPRHYDTKSFGDFGFGGSQQTTPRESVVRAPLDDSHSQLERLHRQLSQENARIAALDAEEAQLSAEERALQLQLRDVTAQHKRIDGAMLAMHHEWSDVLSAERELRNQPIQDLSPKIAHAEGCVEMVRHRLEETEAQQQLMLAQLEVVGRVEQHRAEQVDEVERLAAKLAQLSSRRTQLIALCDGCAVVEAQRESTAGRALSTLDAAERTLAAQREAEELQIQQRRAASLAQQQQSRPQSILRSSSAVRAPMLGQCDDGDDCGGLAPELGMHSAVLATTAEAANVPRSRNVSKARSCAMSQSRSGAVSFALELEERNGSNAHSEDGGGDYSNADFDMGAPSAMFPTAAAALGKKRVRIEGVA